ncbi:hypothetical protein FKM82_021402 [Ascaphus truei]
MPVLVFFPFSADREFIESRRRALKRFVNLVARHPSFWDDLLVKMFLTYNGQDFLPADIQVQFAASRELIRNIFNSFYKLRDRAERIAARAIDNATDLLGFGKELSALGSDTTPLPSWAALDHSTWGALKQALKGLSVEFALLADKAAQQVSASTILSRVFFILESSKVVFLVSRPLGTPCFTFQL